MSPFIGLPRGTTDPHLRGVGMAFSEDEGRTWGELVLLHMDWQGDICATEPDLLRLADGRFLAMIRSNATGRLYRSVSADDGRSWTPLVATNLPGHSPALLLLASRGLTSAIRRAGEVTDTAYHAAGATAVFESNPFERRFRDVNAVTQQFQGSEVHFSAMGRYFLGMEPAATSF